MRLPTLPGTLPLQSQLDEITANTRALVPSDRLARLEQVIAELHATGIENQLLPCGSPGPSFTLRTPLGKTVALADLLSLGPVVLKFFRGRWDPYDMTELELWESLLPTLRQRHALLVALSPQTLRQNGFTADRHHLTFPLLTDRGCTVATQYGLAYTVPEPARNYFRSILVNIPLLHGDEDWTLPLPATCVLSPAGEVRFLQGFADHRRRPDPDAVLAALDALAAPAAANK